MVEWVASGPGNFSWELGNYVEVSCELYGELP